MKGSSPNGGAVANMTPSRGEEYSPMHCVKAVPRDCHAATGSNASDADANGGNTDGDANGDTIQGTNLASEFSHAPSGTEPIDAGSSWMGRKVDALFSPVLSFLNGKEDGDRDVVSGNDGDMDGSGRCTDGDIANDEDNDAVSTAIRSALLEASKELEEDANHTDYYVPVMTKTDSSKDADGSTRSKEEDDNLNTVYANDADDDDSTYQGHTPTDDYDDEEEFNPFLFIKSLPPYPYAIPPGWTSRPKALPPPSPDAPPLCLVLDLDETLVHCTVDPIPNADMVFPVPFNGVEYKVHVRCRPYLQTFLERVGEVFEVVVFTASQQVYADMLLDRIDPGEFFFFGGEECFVGWVIFCY